jgi:hypothetical protein
MASDDLEPIDLEPVDPEFGGDGSEFEREPATNRTRAWLIAGCIGLGLAAWIAVAASTHPSRPRPDATPATTTTTVAAASRIDRSVTSGAALQDGLTRLGVERFAAVIDDRLYTFDTRPAGPTLVPLPEGHVVISGQNGSSLLASTSQETLVSTQPVSTQTLSVRDTPIAAVRPDEWWRLRSDQTIRLVDNVVTPVPLGLRVVAEVPGGGFLAQGAQGWVVWSSGHIKPINASGEFLTAGPHSIAFKDGCGYSGCLLEIYDVAAGTTVAARLSEIPEFASFSPDGSRLAVDSTQGDVSIIDPVDAEPFDVVSGINFPSPSQAFTWTSDSHELLVVQDHRIAVLRAEDGTELDGIGATDGVEQIAALP